MKAISNSVRMSYNEQGLPELTLTLTTDKHQALIDITKLKQVVADKKLLTVEVSQYRHKRSLDSNGYMWLLLGEMAAILKTTKDELYLEVLSRYGVYTHVIVKENVVERVKSEWKTTRELGEVTINGKTGIQLQCFFGSSSYDSKEMSVLIDGVVSECKELGIETMLPSEIERLKGEWKK